MKNRIIPQMFDVRPVDNAGDLDWQKIQVVGIAEKEKREVLLAQKIEEKERRQKMMRDEAIAYQEELRKNMEYNRQQHATYEAMVMEERARIEEEQRNFLAKQAEDDAKAEAERELLELKIAKAQKKENFKKKWFGDKNSLDYFSWQDVFSPKVLSFQFDANKSLRDFVFMALIVFLGVGGVAYASKGFGLKEKVMGSSTDGLENINSAIEEISKQNFEGSSQQFAEAYANFSEGSNELESMGGVLIDATRFVPFASKLASGKNAVEAGKHFSAAGQSLNEVVKIMSEFKNPIENGSKKNISLLDFFQVAQKNIIEAKTSLDLAQQNIDRISIDDLPNDKRDKFLLLKQKLPELRDTLDFFLNNSQIVSDLLGGNGPRKYLFLFQNNSEMRATGGFIGTYGLLDVANGHVKKFFIDGIFNPDGQLREGIVPPVPIQKISAAWSMHDSNWFANFPVSAKKAIQFYEKTGGPTADGVITLTPTVMQKLLEITGPIEMMEYDVTLNGENFVELTQNEVEVEYDKQDNRPKKILSDLAPLVLEKLLNNKDLNIISKTATILLDALKEKHILLYSENKELQKIISEQNWSGEIVQAPKDYISVVNSNINGFKTDAVVEEKIEHQTQIQEDGSIIDTVIISRKHNGGNSQYEWFNKVNADYMRVYVPTGAKLLEVNGQTREVDKSPLDYDALDFKRDSDVQNQENSMEIDEVSGTRVYKENDKTVFANWVYVSPQETAIITYKYVLPFALFQVSVGEQQQVDSYSLAVQKQSGSVGSSFVSRISYPQTYDVKWKYSENAQQKKNEVFFNERLNIDRFVGIVFEKDK